MKLVISVVVLLIGSLMIMNCSDNKMVTQSENSIKENQTIEIKPIDQAKILAMVEDGTANEEPKFIIEEGFDIAEYNTDDQELSILKERIKEGDGLLNKSGGYRHVVDIKSEEFGYYNRLTVGGILSHQASWQGGNPPLKTGGNEKGEDGIKRPQRHEMLIRSITQCESWTNLFYMKTGLSVRWKNPLMPDYEILLDWTYIDQYYTDYIGLQFYKDYMANWEAEAYGHHFAYNYPGACGSCFDSDVYFNEATFTHNYTWW